MPTYSYKCPQCGWQGDRINVRIKDMDTQTCEELDAESGYISVDPDVKAGTPCITGSRLPVHAVLSRLEHEPIEDLIEDYPEYDGAIHFIADTDGRCNGELVREEIPEDQARMSYNWSEWSS